jgi:hypothetical protein
MSRDFGKLYMTAWSDVDFTALSGEAQRMYMFLLSQPDLSRAGTITLALNRWATRVGNYVADDLVWHIYELSQAGFVVVDGECEELLVRSYIRRDEGWKSPNIMVAIEGAAKNVMSESLRAVIRDEVLRIDTSTLPTKINERTGRSTKDFVEMVIHRLADELSTCEKADEVTNWNPSSNGFANPSRKGSKRKGLPKGLPKGSLTTTTTATTTATATATATTTAEPEGFDEFWEIYPRHMKRGDAIKAFHQMLKAGASVDEIIAGARRFAADPNLPEQKFIPYPASWLRAEGWLDDPLPPRNRPQPQRPTRVEENMQVVRELMAQDELRQVGA